MAPMSLPSRMIGKPPSIGNAGDRSTLRLAPLWASVSSWVRAARRKRAAVLAFQRDLDAPQLHVVQVMEADQEPHAFDDGDRHRPVLPLRLGLGRREDPRGRVQVDRGTVGDQLLGPRIRGQRIAIATGVKSRTVWVRWSNGQETSLGNHPSPPQ